MVVDQLEAPPFDGGYVKRWRWIAALRQLWARRRLRWFRRRRSRSSYLLGVATGLLVAALATATVVVVHAIWTYQPLQLGGGRGVNVFTPDGKPVNATNVDASPLQASFVWHPPATPLTVKIGFSLRNAGRYAVTVDEVSLPTGPLATTPTHPHVTMNDEHTGIVFTGAPFRRFSLAPDTEELMIVTFTLPCTPIQPGNERGLDQALVTYEFLGVHHQVAIDLDGASLNLDGPATC